MDKIKSLLKKIRQPLLVSIILMVLCGLVFPLLFTGVATVLFPSQARGSIIEINEKPVGSRLVGQEFTKPYFMKCRPSAVGYNTYYIDDNGNEILVDGNNFSGVSSGSNNYAPTNDELAKRVENDIEKFLEQNPSVKKEDIPSDLLTASGSGLDPHISVESAKVQVSSISKASGISEDELNEIIENNTSKKFLGVFGENVVNVLLVNIDIAQRMGIIE